MASVSSARERVRIAETVLGYEPHLALQRYDTHLGTWEQVRHIKVGTSAVVNLQPMERVLFRGSAFEGYRWSRVEFCHVEDGVYVIENLKSR